MIDKTLRQHVKKCGELKAQIDALTALFNAEKETITGELKSRNTKDFTASGYKVSFTEFTQNRLDTKALKAKYPALCAEYSKDTITNRFTVAVV